MGTRALAKLGTRTIRPHGTTVVQGEKPVPRSCVGVCFAFGFPKQQNPKQQNPKEPEIIDGTGGAQASPVPAGIAAPWKVPPPAMRTEVAMRRPMPSTTRPRRRRRHQPCLCDALARRHCWRLTSISHAAPRRQPPGGVKGRGRGPASEWIQRAAPHESSL